MIASDSKFRGINGWSTQEWQAILNECRTAFGPAPRKFSRQMREDYLDVPPFDWELNNSIMNLNHRLMVLDLPRIYAEGVVTWGCVVQANSGLYGEPGESEGEQDDHLPGEAVYPANLESPVDPAYLNSVAEKIGELDADDDSGRLADEELTLARHLAAYQTQQFGFPVSARLAPRPRCRLSTLNFVRHHLPTGKLEHAVFPLLVSPVWPHTAAVLPSRFWPQRLRDHWEA